MVLGPGLFVVWDPQLKAPFYLFEPSAHLLDIVNLSIFSNKLDKVSNVIIISGSLCFCDTGYSRFF